MRARLRGGGGLVRAWAAFAGRRIGLLTWTAPTLALEMWIIGPLFIWAVVLGAPGNTLMIDRAVMWPVVAGDENLLSVLLNTALTLIPDSTQVHADLLAWRDHWKL